MGCTGFEPMRTGLQPVALPTELTALSKVAKITFHKMHLLFIYYNNYIKIFYENQLNCFFYVFKKHNLEHIRWASHVNSTYLNLTAYLRHLYSSFSYDRSEEKLCSAISPMTSWYSTLKLGQSGIERLELSTFLSYGYATITPMPQMHLLQ